MHAPFSGFGKALVGAGLVSSEQLAEATRLADQSRKHLHEEVIRLGYAPAAKVMQILAKAVGTKFVSLADMEIPGDVVGLVPESMARENTIIPLSIEGSTVRIATTDPADLDIHEKLQFILNRTVEQVLAVREEIIEAINRSYGMVEGESADSILQEFTDTAIDFTETEDESTSSAETTDESSAPIVRLVNLMITEAVQL